jgi:7,8-dihydro-6-hydroxymethylpterin-pyrophosphokinase
MMRGWILVCCLVLFLAYTTDAYAVIHKGAGSVSTQPSPRPRSVVFGLRSYVGSRYGFLWAASSLLTAKEDIKITGISSVQRFAAHGDEPAYLAAAMLIDTQRSVPDLLSLARELETQLADPTHPGARSTLRADILWVEGVELKTPEIELPSPLLFTTSWAIGTFAEAAEPAVKDKVQAIRFYDALKKAPPPHLIDQATYQAMNPELNRTTTSDEWVSTENDFLDALASAVRILAISQVDAESQRLTTYQSGPDRAARNAGNRVDATPGSEVVYVEDRLRPDADDSQLVDGWLSAVQRSLCRRPMRLATAVVFGAGDGAVRGLIVGKAANTPPPVFKLLGADVDRDPEDLRKAVAARKTPPATRIKLILDKSLRSCSDILNGAAGH